MNPVQQKNQRTDAAPTADTRRDSVSITDNRTGKAYELPVTHGTIRALDLRQIKTGADDFGLMTYDPALNNTASCISRISFIDGEKGILRYRGYPIEELAEKSTYLETAYLILHGELPTKSQLDDWTYHIYASHVHPRKYQEISGWISLRRPSDGHDDFHHRRAFHFLSGRERDLQQRIAPQADLPPDRKNAHTGGFCLSSQPGHAVRVSG